MPIVFRNVLLNSTGSNISWTLDQDRSYARQFYIQNHTGKDFSEEILN